MKRHPDPNYPKSGIVGITWHSGQQQWLVRSSKYYIGFWVGGSKDLEVAKKLLKDYLDSEGSNIDLNKGKRKHSSPRVKGSAVKKVNSERQLAAMKNRNRKAAKKRLIERLDSERETHLAEKTKTLVTLKPFKQSQLPKITPLLDSGWSPPMFVERTHAFKEVDMSKMVETCKVKIGVPLLTTLPDRCQFCQHSYTCSYDYDHKNCNSYQDFV